MRNTRFGEWNIATLRLETNRFSTLSIKISYCQAKLDFEQISIIFLYKRHRIHNWSNCDKRQNHIVLQSCHSGCRYLKNTSCIQCRLLFKKIGKQLGNFEINKNVIFCDKSKVVAVYLFKKAIYLQDNM